LWMVSAVQRFGRLIIMDSGRLDSILNKLHMFICEIMECETDSVQGEYVKEYLSQNKERVKEIFDIL